MWEGYFANAQYALSASLLGRLASTAISLTLNTPCRRAMFAAPAALCEHTHVLF